MLEVGGNSSTASFLRLYGFERQCILFAWRRGHQRRRAMRALHGSRGPTHLPRGPCGASRVHSTIRVSCSSKKSCCLRGAGHAAPHSSFASPSGSDVAQLCRRSTRVLERSEREGLESRGKFSVGRGW